MNRPTIGFDLDDIIFDFMGPLCEWHNTTHGTTHGIDDYVSFDLHTVWQIEGAEAHLRVSDFYASEHHQTSLPVLGAIEALNELHTLYRLIIVTARPDTMEAETHAWLAAHLPGIFDEVIFTNHFYNTEKKRTKSSVCREQGVKVFVEDALHNAIDIAAAGIPVLLLDTPWNRVPLPDRVTRVSSWEEIVQKIKEY